ncbi:hypothetical protein HPB49_021356 [Dermacentor silvarum]|uniref:Uncharacterized protein n=1 Tax=Dermacentor silvarum TaxID=543639 RepID=A0ACB8D020_DERSI|nr:hypothetical protein HPB49_021356 [Dermacentor silvarum]
MVSAQYSSRCAVFGVDAVIFIVRSADSRLLLLFFFFFPRAHCNHVEAWLFQQNTPPPPPSRPLHLRAHLQDRSVSGVYQWCGLEPLTKYAMVRAIGQTHGLSTDHVSPDAEPSSGAPRPRDCRLEHSRLQQLGIARHTPFAQGVAGFARFLQPAAGQQP